MNAPFHLRANVEAMVWSRTHLDACLSVTKDQEVRVGSRGGVTTVSWLPDQRDLPVVAKPDRATVWITVPDQAVPAGSDEAATRDRVVGIARAAFAVEAADQDQAEATRNTVRILADHLLVLLRQRHPEIMPLTLHLLAPTPACNAVLSIGEEHTPVPHELLAAYGIDPVWLVDGMGDALHSLNLRPVGCYARADRADPASLMRAVHAPGMERLLDAFATLLPSIAERHGLVP